MLCLPSSHNLWVNRTVQSRHSKSSKTRLKAFLVIASPDFPRHTCCMQCRGLQVDLLALPVPGDHHEDQRKLGKLMKPLRQWHSSSSEVAVRSVYSALCDHRQANSHVFPKLSLSKLGLRLCKYRIRIVEAAIATPVQ